MNKIKCNITVLDKELKTCNLVTEWHKDGQFSIHGVNLGECLEYSIMESLVMHGGNSNE